MTRLERCTLFLTLFWLISMIADDEPRTWTGLAATIAAILWFAIATHNIYRFIVGERGRRSAEAPRSCRTPPRG